MSRFCFVIPSLHPGGMERVMSLLALYFSSLPGVDLHIIIYGLHRDVFYEIPDNVTLHTPSFVFYNSRRFYSSIKTLFYLRKAVREIDPKSVLSFGEYWNSYVLISLFGLKIPVFISDRCQPDKDLGRFHNVLRKFLYPRSAGLIAQTYVAKEIYQKQLKHSNIPVIGNPFHMQDEPVEDELRENIVLTVGRLIRSKHHDMLIKMFLESDLPHWKLVIVGDDAQKQDIKSELVELVKELGAGERVILAGNQSDVEDYYRRSKIFAFASSSEGFPNVIGEAQSYGLPVVAFDCIAGPSDLIEDGVSGYLVAFGDTDLYKARLKQLVDSDSTRSQLGRAGWDSIRTRSLEEVGSKYLTLLENPSA